MTSFGWLVVGFAVFAAASFAAGMFILSVQADEAREIACRWLEDARDPTTATALMWPNRPKSAAIYDRWEADCDIASTWPQWRKK